MRIPMAIFFLNNEFGSRSLALRNTAVVNLTHRIGVVVVAVP